jgi:hypothetical protein
MLKQYVHILPEAQKKLWPLLSPCKDLGFCLYGGTAVSLHLGHRISVDFDFFSYPPLDESKEKILLDFLPFLADAKLIQSVPNTRTYVTDEGVALSFFGNISFGRVGEPLPTDDAVLQVASLQDLMATKLAVMIKRTEIKDYQDIAAILRSGMDLHDGLAYAKALYKQFPACECVRAMVYFDEKRFTPLSIADRNTLIMASKNFHPAAIPHALIVAKDLVFMQVSDKAQTPLSDTC